ncbi:MULTISPECIES: RtcB family protein [Delftia]|uniref:3'-phosphate/5'-hydroxy nucleic acid ligase n=1 Tax=Delftia tsuruhatensis TaxID=180282 RepID=A0AAX3SLR9_9BURK|nr:MULTISPECIES: RtcB family protein [Delftia]KEH09002.1 RNA ligase [Delftia tsuruhatensis]MDH0851600.1 RtcB family protein [Delftia tsuruhatensis]WEL98711.1 RtcB family protein [Delftia tsuruhatensis]WFF81008.1 RtcB family protein [Delftia tsuruhatensis]WQM83136.1 RtcB family protein [Delftia tsuruhatensis]
MNYLQHNVENGVPIKMWTKGVPVEDEARKQLENAARLPVVFKHVAAMPDVHLGIGATVGSVIPTIKAIIPAAVGVDIGCGMMAAKTTLRAEDLPDNLGPLRSAIEQAVPHGSVPRHRGRDPGSWENPPVSVDQVWATLAEEFDLLCELHPRLANTNNRKHLGTLGSGNHFIEICLDEAGFVWFMLHSGSRGVGNAIGTHFIELAKKDAELHQRNLPDKDLAYFEEGARYFGDYVRGVSWAQKFAMRNREVMMANLIATVRKVIAKPFESHVEAVNCHHNYVQQERHFGQDVFITRKGAVSARRGELGIIPGSMGARSYIVRGLGNPESFESCSHGAGRVMSRTKAKKMFSVEDHIKATEGVECRKDANVVDEIPMAYKDIDAVMAAQQDLVEVVHTLKQVVCVKG